MQVVKPNKAVLIAVLMCTVVTLFLVSRGGSSSFKHLKLVAGNHLTSDDGPLSAKFAYKATATTSKLHYIGVHLDVSYSIQGVFVNYASDVPYYTSVRLGLTNTGNLVINNDHSWVIYMHAGRQMFQSPHDIFIEHVHGDLFRFNVGQAKFHQLYPGQTWSTVFHLKYTLLGRSDINPNWFVSESDPSIVQHPVILESTRNQSFVTFPMKFNQLRFKYDREFTNHYRFQMNVVSKNTGNRTTFSTLPTVQSSTMSMDELVTGVEFQLSTMKVFTASKSLKRVAKRFADEHKMKISSKAMTSNILILEITDSKEKLNDSYTITHKYRDNYCRVSSRNAAGVYYGLQTLLDIQGDVVMDFTIRDWPRFPYRGIMIDVARNFFAPSVLHRLMDEMSRMKLNKLHLHLSDDQGWRLAINGLEELTSIGAKRSFDVYEKKSLMSNLGSGPFVENSGTGFYSVKDYVSILKYASDRYIEVIPEIDMPGHSHAAITSMARRSSAKNELKYKLINNKKAGMGLSPQHFSNNALDPCMNSTYEFINKVISEIKLIYKQSSHPLKIFHFGGDEVHSQHFEDSDICRILLKDKKLKKLNLTNSGKLQIYFKTRLSEILASHGLQPSAWGDAYHNKNEIIKPSDFIKSSTPYAQAWMIKNGRMARAYSLANAGYKTILSTADKLYFDHPQEPHSDERGLYWATRYISTKKVHSFNAHNIYASMDNKTEYLCDECPQLTKPENVIGIEACVWTETIKNEKHLQEMLYPRLHAFAEKAWHEPKWETFMSSDGTESDDQVSDWSRVSRLIGRKVLPRLEAKRAYYHLGLPGINYHKPNKTISICGEFSGMNLSFSYDNHTWQIATNHTLGIAHQKVYFIVRSFNNKRRTESVLLQVPNGAYKLLVY